MRRPVLAALAAAVLGLAGPALAQHEAGGGQTTAHRLGAESDRWKADPHMHQFYDLTKATLGGGGGGAVDVSAYEQKSFAIFRDFGASHGMKPEAMQDHLKLIPRQMVEIVKADPHTLDSYESFSDALFGPK